MRAADPISQVFAALADPTRREILATLSHGPASVGQVAEPFGISAPAVAQHLKVLERAGLITRTVDAQWRRLTLDPEPLDEAEAWIQKQRHIWELRLDSLEQHLGEMKKTHHDDKD